MEQYNRDKLVEENQRLVYYLYEKLKRTPFVIQNKDDIISEGMVGLVKAANNFDHTRGIRFSTFAARCINNEMLMFIRRVGRQTTNEVSLFAPVGHDEDGSEITYADILSDENDRPEQSIAEYAIEIYMEGQSEIDREIISALRQGYKQKEIAALVGLKQPTVSRHLRRLRKEISKRI